MNRYPIYCPKDLKRVQTRIYNSLDTKTPYIVNGTHYCSNEERYNYLSEEDPNTIIIETKKGMLEELNIALYIVRVILFLVMFVLRVMNTPSKNFQCDRT